MPDPSDLPHCLHSLNICWFLGAMCPCDDASLVAPRFPSCEDSGGGCEGGLFLQSLLKTLAIGDGLRECLLQCLLLSSVRAVGVLDSE
ncbi:hypothetical protein Tco_1137198 [Tanacetum coccineum]